MSEQENDNKCGCCCAAFGKCCGPAPGESSPPAQDANTCESGGCPVSKPEKPADSGPGCGCG